MSASVRGAALLIGLLCAVTGCGAGAPRARTPASQPVPGSASGGTGPGARASAPSASGAGGPPASSSGAPVPAPARVTGANNGQTVAMRVGQTITLALGNLQWSVRVADPTILAPVPDEVVVQGEQGTYRAMRAGETGVSASGRPICAPAQACPMFIVAFRVTVQVTG